MQTLDPGFYMTAAGIVVGVIVWLVRLEGRVNTTEQRFADLKGDVEYIREKIDDVLKQL